MISRRFTKRDCASIVAAAFAIVLSSCSGGSGVASLPGSPNTGTSSNRGTGIVVSSQTQSSIAITLANDVTSHAKIEKTYEPHGLPLQTVTGSKPASTRTVYPDDLSYGGGRVYTRATEWDVYVDCPSNTESCWGRPEEFQQRLDGSQFILVLDQYVGAKGLGRYALAPYYVYSSYTPSVGNIFTAGDILNLVHAAASLTRQTGYPNVYHIFLPQGYDTCADQNNTDCYSPDNSSTWFFCAYHSSVTFNDIGHVIYTVEPYQNVPGCNVPGNNSDELELSTASTLSHEFFESQTDPDPPTGYTARGNYGEEIGDECRIIYENMQLGAGFWLIQMEYSNTYHACADGP